MNTVQDLRAVLAAQERHAPEPEAIRRVIAAGTNPSVTMLDPSAAHPGPRTRLAAPARDSLRLPTVLVAAAVTAVVTTAAVLASFRSAAPPPVVPADHPASSVAPTSPASLSEVDRSAVDQSVLGRQRAELARLSAAMEQAKAEAEAARAALASELSEEESLKSAAKAARSARSAELAADAGRRASASLRTTASPTR